MLQPQALDYRRLPCFTHKAVKPLWPAFHCCRYKAALRACPSCPAEVRLGIAACCLKLGHTAKAEHAYRRTLEMEPGCTSALLGLAVLKLHVSDNDQVRNWLGVCVEWTVGDLLPMYSMPCHRQLHCLWLLHHLYSQPSPAFSACSHSFLTCLLCCRACVRARIFLPRLLSRTLRARWCSCCLRTSAFARALRTRCGCRRVERMNERAGGGGGR